MKTRACTKVTGTVSCLQAVPMVAALKCLLAALELDKSTSDRNGTNYTTRTPAPLIASCFNAMSASLASASGNVRT